MKNIFKKIKNIILIYFRVKNTFNHISNLPQSYDMKLLTNQLKKTINIIHLIYERLNWFHTRLLVPLITRKC